jgi:putative PIN family toxin of toxin-antitoxin system
VVSATADSNVWVSAFNFPGKPRQLIEMADAGEISIVISQPIIEEVLRVLREKLQWSDEALIEVRLQMEGMARKVTPTEEVDDVREDPADNRILECASVARSDYIVSGDNDLLRAKMFRDMPIVKVSMFLDLVAKGTAR